MQMGLKKCFMILLKARFIDANQLKVDIDQEVYFGVNISEKKTKFSYKERVERSGSGK